jgi:hypothetical protein
LRVVLEGLSPTDRLVVNGLQRARPGISVKATASEIAAAGTGATGGAQHP